MNRTKWNFPLVKVLAACFFLGFVILPAAAFPADRYGPGGEGAIVVPAVTPTSRTVSSGYFSPGYFPPAALVPDHFAGSGSSLVATSAVLGTPRSLLTDKVAGYGGQTPAGFSGKGALIDKLAGRNSSPANPAGGTSRVVSGEGTVCFIELDGGFFGIITPAGEKFRPDNLPAAMKNDGVQIRFQGIVRDSAPDTLVWGKPISLTGISLLSGQIAASGTVKFIEFEGGFFGIITPDGKKYLPLNLPAEFQADGMLVTFTAHEKTNVATIFMWGIPVELDSIKSAGGQFLSLKGSWFLREYDGQSPIPGTMITAEFGSRGVITGNAGCNQYFAQYTVTGSGLTVGAAGSTKMYCSLPEGIREQENEYLALLTEAATWAMNDGNLVIRDASGREILVYTTTGSDEPAPLIEYSRTGGLAGVDDHLVLFANGSGTVTRSGISRSARVSPPVMADLISHITAADFPTLKEHYPAPTEGADYFTYTLTSGGRTVVTEDTGIPPLLEPVINTLNDILSSVRMPVEYSHSGIPNFF